MARWFSKRWVFGSGRSDLPALGMSAGSAEEPPKVGSTISLPIDGKTARQFKVLKSEKQPDGTYLSELKDINSGETLTFLTRPNDEPLKSAPSVDDGKLGKAKAPPFPMPSDPPKSDPPKEKDKHPFLSRIFGDKEKDKTPTLPVMPGGNPPPNTDSTSDKKPGLFARIFGPKKPTGPSMPAASMAPVIKPSSSTPPPVLPVPQGGLSANAPAFPATGTPPLFPNSSPSSTEPPRVMPSKPQSVVPPVPPVSAPVVPTAPAFPAPTQVPAFPAPTTVPAFPAPTTTPAPLPVQSPTPVPTPVPMPVALDRDSDAADRGSVTLAPRQSRPHCPLRCRLRLRLCRRSQYRCRPRWVKADCRRFRCRRAAPQRSSRCKSWFRPGTFPLRWRSTAKCSRS